MKQITLSLLTKLALCTFLFLVLGCGSGGSDEEGNTGEFVDLTNFQYGKIPTSYSVKKITSDIGEQSLFATEITEENTVVGFWSHFIGAGGGSWFYSGFIAPKGNQAFFPNTGPEVRNNNLKFTDISGDKVLEATNGLYNLDGSFLKSPSNHNEGQFHLNAINVNNIIVGNIDEKVHVVFSDGRTSKLQGDQGLSIASDLNDNNVMVGRTKEGDNIVGFAYKITDEDMKSGNLELKTSDRIGTFGGKSSSAYAINNAGLIVGEADTAEDFSSHAFIYHISIGLIDLGTLGGSSSSAQDINEGGIVVGYAGNKNNESRAFVGTPDSGIKDLNSLVPDMGEVTLTEAQLINNNGVIVALGESGDLNFSTKAIYLLEPND